MLSNKALEFVANYHQAVVSTFRKDGAVQMSIVTCGPYQGAVAFTTTGGRAKLANLKRNPRCSLLVSRDDWRGYLVVEGRARLLNPGDTDPEALRIALRDVYRAAAGKEHPDWQEYDQVMAKDRRSVIVVVPGRVYGTAA